jgi:GntR family transcriptional regulator, arabinose operon transcriptional repressor
MLAAALSHPALRSRKLYYLTVSVRSLSQEGPKYRQILDRLAKDIASGKYAPGQKFPSEAALVRLFGASRITVGRAVRELKELGLVQRIAGSGTYVRNRAGDGAPLFGLLIPDLGETEIFEPICQGMANAPKESDYGLLWGRTETAGATKEEQAWSLCQQFIERRVAGVFFAPLEITATRRSANDAVVKALDKAQIPVVLLDRGILPFPQRSHYDLVGVNNRRAGYLATDHLVRQGCRRILFIAGVSVTSTVQARIVGFREALLANDLRVEQHLVQPLPSAQDGALQKMLHKFRPEGFVCVNDRTAGRLMQSLLSLGCRIPQDIKIVGIDDVEYAKLLPVPLTTIHQPCREIGHAAMAAMFERIKHPNMLARDILLDCELVIRSSCGSPAPANS